MGYFKKTPIITILIILLVTITFIFAQKFTSHTSNCDAPFNDTVVSQISDHVSTYYSSSNSAPEIENTTEYSRVGEFIIDTNVVYTPAGGRQHYPSVAFDGNNCLVVWQDDRSGQDDIYGARVSQTGEVLDPAGIAISTATGNQSEPSIAFDGTNYLVVWEDDRSGQDDIYGARVSQSGEVLDPAGIAISTATGIQSDPTIAFDGTNYLIVWEDLTPYCDIYGARVSQSGEVLDPAGIAISTATEHQWDPSVAFDGNNCLVVWQDDRSGQDDIYGARVSQSGEVLDPAGIAISTATGNKVYPSVAFDGSNYLVVWQDLYPDNIYGARVSQSGEVLDPAGIAISTAAGNQSNPSIAFDGSNYLVVWEDDRSGQDDVYGARVSQAGEVLDPAGIAVSTEMGYQRRPSVAYDGTNYLIVWHDSRSDLVFGYTDIYGARMSQAGEVLDPAGIAISLSANHQSNPSIAFDGTNYLVVWQDKRSSGQDDIYGARVNQSGEVLDPAGIAISTATGNQSYPAVAFDGTNYLVVWHTSYNIYGARVSQSGEVLDTAGIAIGAGERASVAFDGTNYLVVWCTNYAFINGARVSQAGEVLDPAGFSIGWNYATFQGFPCVAFDGTNYLVSWELRLMFDDNPDIVGRLVSQSGALFDFFNITNHVDNQRLPSVCFGDSNYIVVWSDDRLGGYDIWGARVSQTGIAGYLTGISMVAGDQGSPSVDFDGVAYLVAWDDTRNGVRDIYGARVDSNMNVIESFVVSSQSGEQITPSVAHGAGEQVLITYSGWCDSINNHPVNALRIWGKFYPFVGIEESTNIAEPLARNDIVISPNPAKTWCMVSSAVPINSIRIYNILGAMVLEDDALEGCRTRQVSLTGMSAGVYFIGVNAVDSEYIKKIIVTR